MIIYTVKSGDTLGSIARRYGISMTRIAADNQLKSPAMLSVGQSLILNTNSIRYILDEGQTLYSISQEYGVPLDALIAANPELNPFNLQAGDTVIIPIGDNSPKRPIMVNGYAYPSINTNSLNCALPFLTYISPFSYSITPQGELIAPDDSDLIYRSLRSAVMPLMVVTNIFDGTFSTDTISNILADSDIKEKLISGIVSEAEEKGYYGVNVDIEYIAPQDREAYNDFLRELVSRLHERGFIVMSALAPKTSAEQKGILYESHDYAAQGEIVDYIIIMTYEWGYTYGPPLAVSPINEIRKVLDYAVSEIPSEKILMSMPNYGYDWTLPYMRETAARSIGFNAALELAQQYNAEIKFDENTQTPYFNYVEDGKQHIVWFDDARSISEKLKLIDEYDLAGVSYWTVNRCYVPNWLVLQNMFEIVKL